MKLANWSCRLPGHVLAVSSAFSLTVIAVSAGTFESPTMPAQQHFAQTGSMDGLGATGVSDVSKANNGETCATNSGKQARLSKIVHTASGLAALADGGLAQIPGAGTFVIPTIQAGMVFAIGSTHGCHLTRSHAMTLVTYFASNHVKKALFKEMIGIIPFAGPAIKASITFFMTEGIGNVADRMLACQGASELLKEAMKSSAYREADDSSIDGGDRRLFHIVSDYLGNLDFASLDPSEVWQRSLQLFSPSQENLLAKVRNATQSSELVQLVTQYVWNLEVVEASLTALVDRFEVSDSCGAANLVASKLWNAPSVSVDSRETAAPYLLHCADYMDKNTQLNCLTATSLLLISTRGGTRGAMPPLLLKQGLDLMNLALEEFSGGDSNSFTVETATGLNSSPIIAEVPRIFAASLEALAQGQPSACKTLQLLFQIARRKTSSDHGAPDWLTIHHLSRLDRIDIPSGAERCFAEFRREIARSLVLPAMPANVELPGDVHHRWSATEPLTNSASNVQAPGAKHIEGLLTKSVLGQPCAIEQLVHHPGYMRLKLQGLWRDDMPLVLLFTGPSGTGKTLLARMIAETLLRQPISQLEASGRFKTFHMNLFSLLEDQKSFFGPPRGVSGYNNGGDLPELLKQWPDAVVLLDEVEKAHPSFARAFLKVFGENGAVYDPRTGQDISTAKATFILTSNLGKDLISEHSRDLVDAKDDPDCKRYSNIKEQIFTALSEPYISGRQNFFRESEVRGRLTDVIPFLPFTLPEVESAVRHFLVEEARVFAQAPKFANSQLAWEPAVVPLLASEYPPRAEEGLRGVNVQLQSRVREVLGSAIDADLLRNFGALVLRVPADPSVGGRLDLRVVSPRRVDTKTGQSSGGRFGLFGGFGLFAGLGRNSGNSATGSLHSAAGNAGSMGSGSSSEFGFDLEFMQDWDWELAWQQLWEFLWEWRFQIAVFAAVLLAGTTASFIPSVSTATAAAAVPSAAAPAVTYAAIGTSAATWLSSIIPALQLAAGLGTAAVPAFTLLYAWQRRHIIAAAIWAAVGVMALPVIYRWVGCPALGAIRTCRLAHLEHAERCCTHSTSRRSRSHKPLRRESLQRCRSLTSGGKAHRKGDGNPDDIVSPPLPAHHIQNKQMVNMDGVDNRGSDTTSTEGASSDSSWDERRSSQDKENNSTFYNNADCIDRLALDASDSHTGTIGLSELTGEVE